MAAPEFPPPVPLKISTNERLRIAQAIQAEYNAQLLQREAWSNDHKAYDAMFRGQHQSPRQGPWEGSANLHIPMPYWLVDSINVRLVQSIWGQIPLVSGEAVEDDDQEILRDACGLVHWHLQPNRMNARAAWSRASKIRLIHGCSASLIPYVKTTFKYRIQIPDSNPKIVAGENPEDLPKLEYKMRSEWRTQTDYDGPIIHPVDWDDLVVPMSGMNLQPLTAANPGGSRFVGIRQYEDLALIWSKRESSYTYIDDHKEAKIRQWWVDNAPSQDRSGTSSQPNSERSRLQDRFEGRSRTQQEKGRPEKNPNPEFECLIWMMPWEIEGEERECVFFWCPRPLMLLGGFSLADVYWKNRRPVVEMHYQRVGTRFYSMGVMEICKHLSAELDTIHNMRMDVGFATNMPFFFYRASTAFDPEKIELRPLKGVPVDDINDVRFPQLQNVTTFYAQEEQLLYTLVERVMGVTDLFLGISPTRGAAARHATGFVGTQQEALARTSDILAGDAEAFSFLCHLIYGLEIQYGPPGRVMRLQGKEGPITQRLSRNQLWMRGEYDFHLGANAGLYSSMVRQQQATALLTMAGVSPLINQDMARRWEAENFYLQSIGMPSPEVFIGPKEAVSAGTPKDPGEENGEMSQAVYGIGLPAPVHPNDNDQEHLRGHMDFISGPEFADLGRPNAPAFLLHILAHHRQIQQKQQAQQMQMQQAQQAPPGGQMPPGGPQGPPRPPQGAPGGNGQPNARNAAQLTGMGSMGAMGDMGQAPGAPGAAPPPIRPGVAGL